MTRVNDKNDKKNGGGKGQSKLHGKSSSSSSSQKKKGVSHKMLVDSSDEEEDDSEYLPSPTEEETTVYETEEDDGEDDGEDEGSEEEEEESEDTEVLVDKFIHGKKKALAAAAAAASKKGDKGDKKSSKSSSVARKEKGKEHNGKEYEKSKGKGHGKEKEKYVKNKKIVSKKSNKKYQEESEEEESEEESEEDSEEDSEEEDSEEESESETESEVLVKSSSKRDKKAASSSGGGILVMNLMDMLENAAMEDDEEYMDDEFAEEYETDEDDEVNTDDEKTFMKETYVDLPNIPIVGDEKRKRGGESGGRRLIESTSEEEENRIRAEEEELAKKLSKCLPASQLKNGNKPLSKKEKEELVAAAEKANKKGKEKMKKEKAVENPETKDKDERDKVMKKYQTLDDMRKFMMERLAKDPDNKILKNALQDIKENIHKLVKKARSENARKFHEMVSEKIYSTGKINDLDYFKKKLSNKEQLRAMSDLKEINEHIYMDKPFRMAILEMDISYKHKAIALSRLDTMKQMEMSSESGGFTKMKEWLETFMRIPFGRYRDLPVKISDGHDKCYEFMCRAKQTLDECTYGLNDAKMQIMQVLGNWISNPNSMGTAIAIRGPPGSGKCLVKDTPVLMYDGSVKMVQDIQVGELLMGDDSTPRTVLALGSGKDDLYDIVPKKGDTYGVNSEHILCLKPSGLHRLKDLSVGGEDSEDSPNSPITRSSNKFKVEYFNKTTYKLQSKRFTDRKEAEKFLEEKAIENDIVDIPVKTLLGLSNYIQSHLKGYSVGAEFASKPVPFDPYIFGVWLGDGASEGSRITNQDTKVLYHLRNRLRDYHLILSHLGEYQYSISYDLHRKDRDTRNNKNQFLQFLKDYSLIKNKHIPDVFKINDRKVQLEILAGLIDTDGYYCPLDKSYEITQKNKKLSDDILFIARSLGFTAYQKECKKSCLYKGEKKEGVYHRIIISGHGLDEVPVKIDRKKAEKRLQKKNTSVTGIKIVAKGHGDYYGFELDGNHRYLLGSFTVTHNTTLVRDGISKILGREFAFITLGGATDSAFLDGFSYTYEGAKWGKIVQILLDSKSMNPVIYFDELDKISTTERGQEISGILTHLTDTSQNNQFHDKYFSEIDFDLSRCLFIFSYNEEALVNPILKDRMYVVETKGYSNKEKVIIAQKYLLPKILEQVFFRPDEVMIPDETIQYMLEKTDLITKEEGVRNLKRALEIIVKKLNLLRLMTTAPSSEAETQPNAKKGVQLFGEEFNFEVKFPMTVTREHVDSLIKKADVRPKAWDSMYV